MNVRVLSDTVMQASTLHRGSLTEVCCTALGTTNKRFEAQGLSMYDKHIKMEFEQSCISCSNMASREFATDRGDLKCHKCETWQYRCKIKTRP